MHKAIISVSWGRVLLLSAGGQTNPCMHYYKWKTYVTQSLKYFSSLYGDCNVTRTKTLILPSICLPLQTASASLNLTFWSQLTQQILFVKYVIEAYSKQTWIYHFINIGRWDNKQEIKSWQNLYRDWWFHARPNIFRFLHFIWNQSYWPYALKSSYTCHVINNECMYTIIRACFS